MRKSLRQTPPPGSSEQELSLGEKLVQFCKLPGSVGASQSCSLAVNTLRVWIGPPALVTFLVFRFHVPLFSLETRFRINYNNDVLPDSLYRTPASIELLFSGLSWKSSKALASRESRDCCSETRIFLRFNQCATQQHRKTRNFGGNFLAGPHRPHETRFQRRQEHSSHQNNESKGMVGSSK